MRLVTGAVRATALAAVLRGACQGLMRRSTLRSCVAMRARRCDHMHTHGVRERRRHSPSSAGKQIFANHGCNPARRRLRRPAFQLQQGLFGRQPATESGQCATGTDDAVTGQHDRQRIAAVCGAHRTAGSRPAHCLRQLRVTPGFTERNAGQRLPDLQLERRAGRGQWQVEAAPPAIQIIQRCSRAACTSGASGPCCQSARPGASWRFCANRMWRTPVVSAATVSAPIGEGKVS